MDLSFAQILIVSLAWILFLASLFIDFLFQTGNSTVLFIHLLQLGLLIAAAAATHKLIYTPRISGIRKRLSESASKEAAIINHAVDVIGLIDMNSRFVSVNPAALNVLSYSPMELIGRQFTEFIASEDVDASLGAILGANKSIDKIVFENRWRRKDGSIIHLLWSAHWSASDHGLFCVIHDITERKIAEQAVQESEERTRLILESLPIALFLTNRVGLIEMSNSTAQRLCGYTREDLFGKSMRTLVPHLIKTDNPADIEELSVALSTLSRESLIGKKQGESIPVEVSVREIQIRGERKFAFALLDITERYELDKAKREFVAMISHDLRSPLNNILLTLTILDDGKVGELTENGKQFVEQALAESRRLIDLIKDLLDLEKLASSSFSLHFERTSMLDLIEDSVNAIKNSADCRNLKFEMPEVDIECEADGARIIQVIVNLLSNAVKFAPPGSAIRITLEQDGAELKVSVIDRGRGIPLEKQGKIFEKFAQLEADDWRQKGGSGLGLAICKAIVEQHGGRIGAESTAGAETKFWFAVPMARVD